MDLEWDAQRLIEKPGSRKDIPDEVRSAAQAYRDMWEGNTFVSHNHVSGIIGWASARYSFSPAAAD